MIAYILSRIHWVGTWASTPAEVRRWSMMLVHALSDAPTYWRHNLKDSLGEYGNRLSQRDPHFLLKATAIDDLLSSI